MFALLAITALSIRNIQAIGGEHFCEGFGQDREKVLWASLKSADAEWELDPVGCCFACLLIALYSMLRSFRSALYMTREVQKTVLELVTRPQVCGLRDLPISVLTMSRSFSLHCRRMDAIRA